MKLAICNVRKQKTPNQNSKKGKRILKIQNSVRNLWNKYFTLEQMLYQHLHHGRCLEGEEKEQEIENLLQKIMIENFLRLMKEIDI